MSKKTFAAAARMSSADQGQYNINLKPAGSDERKSHNQVYMPYTTPYTGVGQVVSNQKPMAASGFKVHESAKPITVAAYNSVANLNQPIAHNEKPKVGVLRLPGSYDMSELSTIDRLVRRYRGMKDLPGYKGMNLEQQLALYPEIENISGNEIKDHAAVLKKRKENDVLVFNAWKDVSMRVNDSFEHLAGSWMAITYHEKRFRMQREARIELILNNIAMEVQLLECMKDHPAYNAMVKGMRPEHDPKNDEASDVDCFHQSDDGAPTLQAWWSQTNDTTGKILKAPDGSMSFSPAYMDKVNEQYHRMREERRAKEASCAPRVVLRSISENSGEENKLPPAPAPSLASSTAGEDLEDDQGEDRPYLIKELGGTRAKDMAVTRPYDPECDEELVILDLPEASSEDDSESEDDDDYVVI
ncbi:hypothetical protein PG995_011690 [Apiospora arundinis]